MQSSTIVAPDPSAITITLPLLSSANGAPKSTSLLPLPVVSPMIATDVPGCREIVQHCVTGILIPLRDPNALAEAILRLAEGKDLRQSYGKNARKLVEDYFSTDIVNHQILQLYRTALAASNKIGRKSSG